jgi:hypothetical protein
LELVPLPDSNEGGATYAFFNKMFNRFGVWVKVFINQGMEFQRDFQDYVRKALIDH